MNEFHEYLRGKSVAIVGPAAHMVGCSKGDEIDSHDVVIRLNREVAVAGYAHYDRGSHADVLYSCFYPHETGGIGAAACNVETIKKTGFEWVVGILVLPPHKRIQRGINTTLAKAKAAGMNAFRTPHDIALCAHNLCKGKPNTGTLALFDLASSPAETVSVYGLTFFQTPYEKGYRTNQHDLSKVQSDHARSSHASAANQLAGFRQAVRESQVAFTFDEPLRAIMAGEQC